MEGRPKSAHRYNVQEQQDVYKEEIQRIWLAQYDSLSNPVEPQLTEADEERQRGRRRTPAVGMGTPARSGSAGSRGSSMERDDGGSVGSGRAPYASNKILRIKRMVSPVLLSPPLLLPFSPLDYSATCDSPMG
jgi:hypothetical protein